MGKYGVDQAIYTPKEFVTTKVNEAGGEYKVSKPYLRVDEKGMVSFEPSKDNYSAMVALLDVEGSVFKIVNAGRFEKNVKKEWFYIPEGQTSSSEDLSDLPTYNVDPIGSITDDDNEGNKTLTEDQLIDKMIKEEGVNVEDWGLPELRSMSAYLDLGITGRSKDEFVPKIEAKLVELGKLEKPIEETEE